jgi:hypothetical protein
MKLALAVIALAGCVAPAGEGNDDGTHGSGEGSSGGAVPVADGTYRIVSQIDITAEALLPAQAELAVSTLRGLSTDPAHTLITAAGDAGVPAVEELYGVLPGPLKDQLEDWVADELAGVRIHGVSITEYAAQIAGLADTSLRRFAIDSELTIRPGAARHRLTALDLTPAGLAVQLPIAGAIGDLLTQDTTAAGGGGGLTLGEQHFGVDYGEYAWRALDAVSAAEFGAGIRDALGAAIDCPAVAQRIADRCVLGACVGHAALVTSMCDGGLDAIVGFAHGRMADIRLEALHLARGQAGLADDDRDGIADRITGGAWQAELDLGLGLRHAPATFTGAR